jgi:hypothetical protein
MKADWGRGVCASGTSLASGRFAMGTAGFSHSHQASTGRIEDDSVKVFVHG